MSENSENDDYLKGDTSIDLIEEWKRNLYPYLNRACQIICEQEIDHLRVTLPNWQIELKRLKEND